MTRGNLTRAQRHRRFGIGVVAAALVLTAGGCAASHKAYPEHAPELSAWLYLDSTQVRSGTPIKGTLVVTNSTHHNVGTPPGCAISYQVVLTNTSYHPMVVWPAVCAYSRRSAISFHPGDTKIAITVQTTYLACSPQQTPGSDVPTCGQGGQVPPLPPGIYYTELVSTGNFPPAPPPDQVTLLSAS
ncbi:MAG TPA: hypothetical protein VNF71_12510 [Acidimicrobiales bacterium]|nr:hypothetical protein [Acidimicrobiales bacterium]